MKKIFYLLTGLILSLFYSNSSYSQATSATYAFASNLNAVITGNVTANAAIPGSSFTTSYSSSMLKLQPSVTWPTAVTTGFCIDFPLSGASGYNFTITGITFNAKTSGSSGANVASLSYQVDGIGSWTSFASTVSIPSGTTSNGLTFGTLSQTFSAGHTYIIRINLYAAASGTSASRSVSLQNVAFSGTTVLPVTFKSINLFKTNEGVNVVWDVVNESGVKEYVVEKSLDGKVFTSVGEVAADNSSQYTLPDPSQTNGIVYYRVQEIDIDGMTAYSATVKNNQSETTASLIVQNPVQGSLLKVQLSNVPKGVYSLSILSNAGQKVYAASVISTGGVLSLTFPLPATIKGGIYFLQLAGNNFNLNKTILIQ